MGVKFTCDVIPIPILAFTSLNAIEYVFTAQNTFLSRKNVFISCGKINQKEIQMMPFISSSDCGHYNARIYQR